VAPIFFFLMFVIAETAVLFVAEQVMDNAVFESARLIRTGQAQKGTWPNPNTDAAPAPMTKADFKADVCARLAVFIDCDSPNFYLDVKSYPNFSAMALGRPVKDDETFEDEGAYAFGGSGDIVVVRAYYQWPATKILGDLSLKNMDNGKRLIGSFAAFRNEPFDPS
jgi:Flp pilus assembly protein TadG